MKISLFFIFVLVFNGSLSYWTNTELNSRNQLTNNNKYLSETLLMFVDKIKKNYYTIDEMIKISKSIFIVKNVGHKSLSSLQAESIKNKLNVHKLNLNLKEDQNIIDEILKTAPKKMKRHASNFFRNGDGTAQAIEEKPSVLLGINNKIDGRVDEGEDVEIKCLAISTFNYDITLELTDKFDKILNRSSPARECNKISYNFFAQPENAGSYTCKLFYEGTYISKTINLIVNRAKFDVEISLKPSIVKENDDTARFLCSANDNNHDKLTWFYNDQIIEDEEDPVYIISNPTQDNNGNYSCEIIKEKITRKATIDFHINFPPKLEIGYKLKSNIFSLKYGSNQILECPFIGYPELEFKWYQKNQKDSVEQTLSTTTRNFEISSLSPTDEGTYTCEASNIHGTESLVFIVQAIPTTVPEFQSFDEYQIKVLAGDSLEVTCIAVNSEPIKEAKWKKLINGKTHDLNNENVRQEKYPWFIKMNINTYENEKISLLKLNFINIQKEDEGIYECEMKNEVGYNRMRIKLSVVEHDTSNTAKYEATKEIIPVIYNMNKVSEISQGLKVFQHSTNTIYQLVNKTELNEKNFKINSDDDYKINCICLGSLLECKNNYNEIMPIIIDENPCMINNDNLIIKYYSKSNIIGIEDISAYNPIIKPINNFVIDYEWMKNEPDHFYIAQYEKPKVILQTLLREFNVTQTNDLELKCSGTGTPNPKIFWTNHDEKFKIFSNPIHITSEDKELTGKWQCNAENDFGFDKSHEIEVKIVLPPNLKPGITDDDLKLSTDDILVCPFENYDHCSHTEEKKKFEKNILEKEGNYTFTASNSGGISRITFVVKKRKFPTEIFMYLNNEEIDSDYEVKFNAGDILTINCASDGWPPNAYTFWLKDTIKFSDHYFTFNPLTVDDAETYTCFAGNLTKSFNLKIYSRPYFTNDDDHIQKIHINNVGDNIELNCNFKGYPKPAIEWYKDDKFIVEDSGVLEIKQIQLKDSGFYKCKITTGFEEIERDFSVDVAYPVEINYISPNLNVRKLKSVILECIAKGKPQPNISWTFNGETQTSTENESTDSDGLITVTSTIKINDINNQHSGVYTCNAQNTQANVERTTELTVIAPLMLVNLNYKIIIMENESKSIDCPIDGYSEVEYSWEPVHPNFRFESKNKIVFIEQATSMNQGQLTCTGKNDKVSETVTFDIQIHSKPKFINEDDENIQIIKSGNISLDCNFIGYPLPEIRWFLTNESKELFGYNSTLTEYNVMQSKSYFCQIENEYGHAQKKFNVNVVSPPKVKGNEYQTFKPLIDTKLVLNCNVHGAPQPKYQWFKNNERIEELENSKLIFSKIKIENSGSYYCIGSNEYGSSNAYFKINVVVPKWSEYTEWSHCSRTCNEGIRKRQRKCVLNYNEDFSTYNTDEFYCNGNSTEYQVCDFLLPCPINGKWSNYSSYSSCSRTCHDTIQKYYGIKCRDRKCNSPKPQYGARNCIGSSRDCIRCNIPNCPIDGQWSEWTSYDNQICPGGRRCSKLFRKCDSPAPKYHGRSCVGERKKYLYPIY